MQVSFTNDMLKRLYLIIFIVAAILVGCSVGDTKNEEQVDDFNQVMHQADSLNGQQGLVSVSMK